MRNYKIIVILTVIVLSISGCSKKQEGKAVINNNKTSQQTKKNDSGDALDVIKEKCILIDDESTLYPIVVYFDENQYVEYIKDSEGSSYKVLDVKSDDKKVIYKLESTYYDSVEYIDIVVEVVDEDTIKYTFNGKESTNHTLISKTEAAVKIKEYEEKIAKEFTIEDKKKDFIIPDSSTRELSREELSSYTVKELSYIRNEIFARNGYVFNTEEYKEYFSQKDWYIPNPNFSGDIEQLNPIEKNNVNLIKELEGKK
ncbi:YARHG domain-containing protein [Romboutsia hominis]|uniref:Prokaryotic membrane lipoprotein lipid attachment site profile n=1 Tax=Romboutsia hominis TaxID=1507512 RepID=A0A2P2BSP7_9FIRM|nr:YARHG domain-containing protein [Romboutsia hominis]CEI73352.1 Prokaryotic membrane lipoprotein lipid attachment site profile [Romboutsia hominis]